MHRRGAEVYLQALEFVNTTKIGGELFDFASTIHDKSAAGAQGNAIFDIKLFEFCQTVLKFLRFNVSSRALYAQMSRRGSKLVNFQSLQSGKSAIERLCTGKL